MAPAPVPAQFAGQTLSDKDTALWAQQGGFTGDDQVIACAVSFAEDGSRRIDEISPVNHDGSRDYGLWQINDKAHAELFAQYTAWWSVSNATMAHDVFAGSGWQAWTTYKSGAYNQFMDRARKAVADNAANPGNVTGGEPGATQTTNFLIQIGDAVGSIASAIFKGVAWIANPHNWVRVGLVTIGGIVVIGTVVSTTKGQLSAPTIVVNTLKGRGNSGNAQG